MLGHSREHLLGSHVTQWDARIDPKAVAEWLHDFPPGENLRFETRHRRIDGGLIDVEIEARATPMHDGKVLIYCSARDVTERKRLQRQLADSEAQLKDLYDRAPCAYYSLDRLGKIVRANATLQQWLGCAAEEVLDRPIADFFTDEGRAQFALSFARFLAEGRIDGVEFDLVPKHGPRRRVRIDATAVTDDDGQFLATRSLMVDITAQHEAEVQARALLQQQEAMLDNDLIGMTRLRHRKTLWANRALERIFGYEHGEMEGLTSRALYLDDASFQALGAEAYELLRAGGRYRTQMQMLRKNGDRVWIDLSGVMLANDESMWMMVDITALKDYQTQVEHIAFHDSLTGLANRLLLADRLKQAVAVAERASRIVGVCYIDLDGFKQVNDSHGHAAGDLLLREVAARLSKTVRVIDTVARLGGDEFVVVLASLETVDEGLAVVTRILDAVAQPYTVADGVQAAVSASLGLAFYPLHGQRSSLLLGMADQAMFQAKRSGKNRLQVYTANEQASSIG